MRGLVVTALALAACAPKPDAAAPQASAPPTSNSAKPCDAGKAVGLVGRTVDPALKGEALRLTGAKGLRVIAPGAMVTMDYREDRLNIETDAAGAVRRFYCG